MEKIQVLVQWCDKNFGATLGDNVPGGVVLATGTFEELQKKVPETLRFHIEGMVEDGDDVPQWLVEGNYEFEWVYVDTATLIRVCESYATLAAISRATGINQHQLSHYANRIKTPRPQQRQRIIDGIHSIGRSLMAL